MKLTIITINYNNLEGLKQTFDSVFKQTFQDFDYIVIDGGSTDGSKAYIEAHQDKLYYWLSEKDNGVYNAMNKGILKANGEYLNFMNSGDVFYDSNVLDKVFSSNINQDTIYGDNMVNYGNRLEKEIPPAFLSFEFLMETCVNHQSTFFKRSLFSNSFLYSEDLKISSDWEFFAYNIIIKGATYKKIDEIICIYDKLGFSSQKENFQLYLDEREVCKQKHFSFFLNHKDPLLEKISFKRKKDIDAISRNKTLFRLLKWQIDFLKLFVSKKV
jgi:glycosyltransferase involved in cell wall biosynthesis